MHLVTGVRRSQPLRHASWSGGSVQGWLPSKDPYNNAIRLLGQINQTNLDIKAWVNKTSAAALKRPGSPDFPDCKKPSDLDGGCYTDGEIKTNRFNLDEWDPFYHRAHLVLGDIGEYSYQDKVVVEYDAEYIQLRMRFETLSKTALTPLPEIPHKHEEDDGGLASVGNTISNLVTIAGLGVLIYGIATIVVPAVREAKRSAAGESGY